MMVLVARRLVRVVAVVAVVASLSWLLVEAAPGSAGERAARAAGVLPPDDGAVPAALRQQLIAQMNRDYDLDRPLVARVAGYLGGLARLDMDRSWRDGRPVSSHVGAAAAATMVLIGAALLLAMIVGLAAAVVAAHRPGGNADVALAVVAALALALPPVWVAIVGLRWFASGQPFSWLPAAGLDGVASAVLPVFTLALVPAFVVARHGRAVLLEALAAPWAVAARARGASQWRVVIVHGLRAGLPALLPLVVIVVAYLLGATMVIEQVFAIDGLGGVLVDAAARGDAPIVVGVCVVAAAILASVSAIVDLVARFTDPREGD